MKSVINTILNTVAITADSISEVIDLRFNYGYAMVCTFTGTPNGVLKIQGSIDQSVWIDIDSQAQTDTTTRQYNKDAIYYPYIRVFWDNTSSGVNSTMTVKICVKGA